MSGKRLLIACVAAALCGLTGCRHWCEQRYCPQQQTACVPCCPAPYNYGAAQAPPLPQPVNYGGQGTPCTCYPAAR